MILLGFGAGLASVVPAVEGADFLVQAAAHPQQVLRGALFQLVMVALWVGVVAALYPSLRRHHPQLALAFAGFRLVAATVLAVGVVCLPLLLLLSQQATEGSSNLAQLHTLGILVRSGRDLVNHVLMIWPQGLGTLVLSLLLLRARLVPGWLAWWGLGAALLSLLASGLVLMASVEVVSAPYLAMNAPMALQELVLGGLLLAAGLRKAE